MSLLSRLDRVRNKDTAIDPNTNESAASSGGSASPAAEAPERAVASERGLGLEPTADYPTDDYPAPEARPGSLGDGETYSGETYSSAIPLGNSYDNDGDVATGYNSPTARSAYDDDDTGNAPSYPLASQRSAYDDDYGVVPAGYDDPDSLGTMPPPQARPVEETGTSLATLSEEDIKLRAYYQHKYAMFDEVLSAIDARMLQSPQRQAVRGAVEKAVDAAVQSRGVEIDRAEREWQVREFVAEIMDFGPITTYLDDPAIGKIVVNNAQEVAIERLGQVEQTVVSFRDDDHLLMLIRRIADLVSGRIDAKVPLLDRPLPDGARVRAKVPPLSPQPALTVEKGPGNPFEAIRRKGERQSVAQPYAQLRERIQQKLVQNLDRRALASSNSDQLRAQVEEMINSVIQEERIALTRAERAALVTDLINEFIGYGPIEPLLADPEVDEVMVNGPTQIYAERKGKLELTPYRFRDNDHVKQVIDRILEPLGRRVDEKSPMVDGRLRDGSRFNAIIPPLSLIGPTMTIRKFARDPFTMTDLINFGTLTREAAQFLQAAVEARLNILISGGTGSGKTTTLNVLSGFIPASERIVTIEDAAELQLRQEHVIRLETRPPNIEGAGEISIRDLVRNALRMRPDRIVVGECRGAEALDMLQAMNTGHDGSLTTGHSNSPRDMLKRLETMVLMSGFDLPVRAIREQISMAIHLIVHQDRMRDGNRRITYITEIVGMEGDVITMQDIFRFDQEYIDESGKIHGHLQPSGMRPKHDDAILRSGVKLPLDLFQPKSMQMGPSRMGRR